MRLLEGERIEQPFAVRYRRTAPRRGYRNGYRYRNLLTEPRMLEHLRASRDRDGEYRTAALPRYQRRQQKECGRC